MKNLVVLNLWCRPPACLPLIHGTFYDLAIIDPVPGGAGYLHEVTPAFKLEHEGYKYKNISRLIDHHPEILTGYDYVFFVDDDYEVSPIAAMRLFETMAHNDLHLAQPALSLDSYASFPITRHVPGLSHRITTLVEIGAPAFSRRALGICLPSFSETYSGWGLDWVWPDLLHQHFGRPVSGIVDEAPARHCSPVSSSQWVLPDGRKPGDELEEVLRRYDVFPRCVTYKSFKKKGC